MIVILNIYQPTTDHFLWAFELQQICLNNMVTTARKKTNTEVKGQEHN